MHQLFFLLVLLYSCLGVFLGSYLLSCRAEKARLSRELKSLRALKEERQRERYRFLGNVSHSLSAPLQAVYVELQSLIEGQIAEEDRVSHLASALRHVHWASQRCRRLTDLSAWQGTKPRLKPQQVTLLSPLLDAIEVFEDSMLGSKIELSLGRELGRSIVVADPGYLKEIFSALIENVIQHSGGSCLLSVESAESEGSIEIVFADNGMGSPPFHLSLDDPDFASRGTGLGLVVANRLVDAHGGTLEIESSPNQGFVVRFALKKAPVLQSAE